MTTRNRLLLLVLAVVSGLTAALAAGWLTGLLRVPWWLRTTPSPCWCSRRPGSPGWSSSRRCSASPPPCSWGILTGTFDIDRLRQLDANLAGGFATASGELLTILLFTALAVGWAVLVGTALRRTPPAARLTEAVVRHRRGLTIVAALGPVPYALARATWLTRGRSSVVPSRRWCPRSGCGACCSAAPRPWARC